MNKLTIIKSGIIDRFIGSSSLLLLLFSYNFHTSNTDTKPNSRAVFLHVSHSDCLNSFDIIVKHGDVIENTTFDALLWNLHLLLFDVILAHASSLIYISLSLSLIIMIMWNDDYDSRVIASFIHLLHIKSNIVVESHDNDLSSSCNFFGTLRVSSHAIARDN